MPKKTSEFVNYIFNKTSFLAAAVFSVLLTYALASIVYFSTLLFNSIDSEFLYIEGVFLQNVTFGLIAFIVTLVYIKWFDHRVQRWWVSYVLIFVAIAFIVFFVSFGFYLVYWKKLVESGYRSDSAATGFLYGTVPCIVGMVYYYLWKKSQRIDQRLDEQEVKLLQLEQNRTRAELAALEARINPHFLYNALNSIASLMHEDIDAAEKMTMNLSKLFRKTTGRNAETFCTLKEEIELVETYLEIEKIRFGGRLEFSAIIPPECQDLKVSTFIIQPLVENAIKHGIGKRIGRGVISITVNKNADFLQISVHDNGPDFEIGENTGYGLMSIQEKLRLLYGTRGSLTINNEPHKHVKIEIPL